MYIYVYIIYLYYTWSSPANLPPSRPQSRDKYNYTRNRTHMPTYVYLRETCSLRKGRAEGLVHAFWVLFAATGQRDGSADARCGGPKIPPHTRVYVTSSNSDCHRATVVWQLIGHWSHWIELQYRFVLMSLSLSLSFSCVHMCSSKGADTSQHLDTLLWITLLRMSFGFLDMKLDWQLVIDCPDTYVP